MILANANTRRRHRKTESRRAGFFISMEVEI
jgi:hypothetical protein